MPKHVTVAEKGAVNGVAELGADSKVPVAQLPEGSALQQKAGKALKVAFTGNPKKATVTFATAFGDANYSVSFTCETNAGTQYVPIIESVVAASFVINMGANNVNNLVSVYWTATKHGE
jgi:hypothetical protein